MKTYDELTEEEKNALSEQIAGIHAEISGRMRERTLSQLEQIKLLKAQRIAEREASIPNE